MDLRHLQTFHAVLREGSFLKAARALGLAQPTVTLHIKELEAELGLPLFERGGPRRLRTAAGDVLAERALPILESVETLLASVAELRDGRSGTLRVGSIEPAASRRLMPLLARLRLRRPGLTIKLETGGATALWRAVAGGAVDVALSSPPAGIAEAPDAAHGLAYEELYQEEIVLLLPRGHRLARVRTVTPGDLDGEPLALTEQGCAYRAAVESALRSRGARAVVALECGSTATLRAAVRHRMALAFVPRLSVSPAPPGTVVRRIAGLPIALPVGLVSRRGSPRPSPVLAAFLDAARRELTT